VNVWNVEMSANPARFWTNNCYSIMFFFAQHLAKRGANIKEFVTYKDNYA